MSTTATPASTAPRLPPQSPESNVAGFGWRDSTFLFYSMINAVVRPDFTILDYGAGRGEQNESMTDFKRGLLNFKGKVARIVGADVDPAVMENVIVDEAHVIRPDAPLPFADQSFDLIFSDWVLEHVDDAALFASEVHRMLKPGGWFFARTPNKWGPIAISSSLVPNRLHTKALSRLQPDRLARDVFPTRYRLNTLGQINRHFPPAKFENCTTLLSTPLGYLFGKPLLYRASEVLLKFAPKAFQPVLIVAVRRK